MDAWIEKAQEILDGCTVDGDVSEIAQQLETVNVSSYRFNKPFLGGRNLQVLVLENYI